MFPSPPHDSQNPEVKEQALCIGREQGCTMNGRANIMRRRRSSDPEPPSGLAASLGIAAAAAWWPAGTALNLANHRPGR